MIEKTSMIPMGVWFFAIIAMTFFIFMIMFKKNWLPLPSFLHRSFDELLNSQMVIDELSKVQVTEWIQKNRAPKPIQVLLVKCTHDWLEKLGYCPQEDLDSEHNLIFIMTEKDSDKILKLQLVSCSYLDSNLKKLFQGKDELLLTD